ncbi:flagellar basal body rod protein FlgB [Paradevosia shaoguanensis]|uniref:flagellar basal body rod protein FlgB n=1 Tax=Paradevosia shaoguanensis TaxID=1335043 RepID=UPI003C747611
MGLGQIPLFAAMTEKMRWHQARQNLLAQNVANAETPGYRGRDLRAFDFEDHMANQSTAEVTTAATNPKHISVSSGSGDGFQSRRLNSFEITPEGNGVTLEDEMMKVTGNQMDYQAVTTLYTRSVRLLRTALGKSA